MLLKRPLDLVGTMPENRVVGERHPLTTEVDKVFTLELGSFYTKSVVIRDAGTGRTLKLDEDYHLLGYNDKAARASGGKQVDTIVVIVSSTVSVVAVDYQAVGGVFSNLTLPFIDLLNQVKNTDRSAIDWMEQIINKPDTIAPTPHTHELYQLSEIEDGVSALTRLLAAIYSLDTKDYRSVYDALYQKIRNVRGELDTTLDYVNSELDLILSKSSYQPGDVIVGDFVENPVKYYPEVDWMLLPKSFLYGNTYSSGTDPLSVDIAPGAGLVARTTRIYVAVPKGGAKFTLERSRSSMKEGESVTIVLIARDASPGTVVPYKITGISAADIIEPLTGNFVLDGSLVGRITLTAVEDFVTEGDEVLRLTLNDTPDVFTTVKINDTSKTPVFDVYYSSDYAGQQRVTTLDEGKTCYFQIRGTDVVDGTEVNLFYSGSATAADFSTPFPPIAKLNGLSYTQAITAIEDARTEGNETLLIKLSMTSEAAAVVAASLTVVDTSKTQSYELYYSSDVDGKDRITQIGEGVEFTLNVIATNVPNGTVIGLNYGGTANINDLESRFDNLTVNNGRASGKMKTRADFQTEGDETLVITALVNAKPVANGTLLILDTSASSTTSLRFSSNSLGSNVITQVNEGDTFYLVVNALSNLPDGTVVEIRYEGQATDADFTRPRSTSATILNQKAVVEYTLKNDLLDEGDEVMRVRVINSNSGFEIGTEQIVIKDTSRAATYQVIYTAGATSDTSINSINEGQTAYLTVLGTNVPNGKVLTCEQYVGGLLAIVSNGDVDVNPPTSITMNNNRGSIPIQLRADMRTEGAEALLGIVRDGTLEVGRREITVNDTSITPTYNMWFSRTENGNVQEDRNFAPASDIWLVVETTGVVNGTRLYFGNWDGAAGNVEALPTEIVISGARTSVKLRGKVLYGGGWSVGGWLFGDSSRTQSLVHNWFTCVDSTPDMYYSSQPDGSNRLTVFNEDDVVYLHIVFPYIGNGHVVGLVSLIAGSGPQAANGHVWEDVNEAPKTVNNRAVTQIRLKGDQQRTGDFAMWFQIKGTNWRTDATVRDTSLPPVINLTVPDQYNGRYVIARELFIRQVGRTPNTNDKIRVIVPPHIILRGSITLWGNSDWTTGVIKTYTYGSAGLDLGGMMADDLTVDVYGKVIGAPNYVDDMIWGTVSGTRIRKVKLGSEKPYAFDGTVGLSATAIATNTRTKLIVRNGGMVLGMGGWDAKAPGEVEIIGEPNGTAFTTGQGGPALGHTGRWADLKPVDATFVVKLEGTGVCLGGGGAGGQGGTIWYSSLTSGYCPMAHVGGGGAPYGGQIWQYNGDSGDPVCPDLFVYEQTPATDAICSNEANRDVKGYGQAGSLTGGGSPLPRFSTSAGARRDFVGGAGGLIGSPGQAGATYAMGSLNQATRESISRPGAAGPVAITGTTVIYDNGIA